MSCEFCRKDFGHSCDCPNCSTPKSPVICSYCNEPILFGEEYILNENNDFRHFDCFAGFRELLQWLGMNIETMEEE